MSSVRLRGSGTMARAFEWVATMGFVVVSAMSQKVGSETCETSTIMPSRFISRTTSRPKSESPRVRPAASPEEPAHGRLNVHVRDI
jgi:hypothetical protein